MAHKRTATTVLTPDNVLDEEPEEDPGHFAVASSEELGKRQIKIARRKLQPGSSGATAGIFQGFKSFGSFTNKGPSAASPANSVTSATTMPKPIAPSFTTSSVSVPSKRESAALTNNVNLNGSESSPFSNTTVKTEISAVHAVDKSFYDQLHTLNSNVIVWIQENFAENPYIDLSPVFLDYMKYMKDLESRNCVKTTIAASSEKSPSVVTSSGCVPCISSVAPNGSASLAPKGPSGNPGAKIPVNLFASGSTSVPSELPEPTAGSSQDADDNETYVPPKAESVQYEEAGSVYSKACKLFFKRLEDNKYNEKGKGVLYLKPLDSGKTQLIVRTDTALGNILLNIVLSKATPCARVGKNNVSLVCVPNPPLDPRKASTDPATMLIRVKDADEADQLLAQLDKYKTAL